MVLRLRSGIQDIAQPVDGDLHLLEILPDLRQPQDGLRHLARDHAEGHELAHRKLAIDHRLGAEQEQRGIGELLNILNGARSARADKPGVEGGRDIGRELFFPLRLHGGLDGGSFDGLHADDGLDQHLLAFGAPVELFLDLLAQGRAHKGGDQQVKRDRKQNDQAELPGIGQQHRDEHEGEEQIDGRKQPLAGEKGADGLKLPHARDRLARGAGLEIAHRQMKQVREQAAPKLDIDAVCRVRERVSAQILQHHVEQADDREAAHQHEQGVVAFVAQDLVDDHLKKQRCHQREGLHEKRGHEHMGQRLPVAPDRGQEPAEAERAGRDARAAKLAGHEQGLRLDGVVKLVKRQIAGLPRDGDRQCDGACPASCRHRPGCRRPRTRTSEGAGSAPSRFLLSFLTHRALRPKSWAARTRSAKSAGRSGSVNCRRNSAGLAGMR